MRELIPSKTSIDDWIQLGRDAHFVASHTEFQPCEDFDRLFKKVELIKRVFDIPIFTIERRYGRRIMVAIPSLNSQHLPVKVTGILGIAAYDDKPTIRLGIWWEWIDQLHSLAESEMVLDGLRVAVDVAEKLASLATVAFVSGK